MAGREQSVNGFKHYENPYCSTDWPASQMEIRFDNTSLMLDFGQAEKPGGG